jgi:hypothetical protein
MSYIDLGRYQFMSAPDTTGLNSAHITSVLDTGPIIQLPYFECYRLVLNTSSVQTTVPQVVQTTSAKIDTSLTTLNMTFPAATTVGNCIVVVAQGFATGTTPSVSGVTIGGGADHFGVIPGTASVSNGSMSIWADPSSAVSSAALVVTYSGATGSAILSAVAYEVSGVLATNTVATLCDYTAQNNSTFNQVNTLTAPSRASTKQNDMFIAAVGGLTQIGVAAPILGTTTIVPSLTALPQVNDSPILGLTSGLLSHWGLSGVIGTKLGYTGTSDIAMTMEVALAAILPVAVQPAPTALPFTVSVDGHVWDQNVTVAGVGFTYDLVRPMALNNGNNIQIQWTSLASSLYASTASNISVTAYFQYDPTK